MFWFVVLKYLSIHFNNANLSIHTNNIFTSGYFLLLITPREPINHSTIVSTSYFGPGNTNDTLRSPIRIRNQSEDLHSSHSSFPFDIPVTETERYANLHTMADKPVEGLEKNRFNGIS